MASGMIACLLCSLTLLSCARAQAPTNRPYALFDTGTPPDAFGVDGFDVDAEQSVGQRFTASAGGPLSAIHVWLMSNSNGSAPLPTVDVALIAGGVDSPSTAPPLETWKGVPVTAAGFAPVEVILNSTLTPDINVGDVMWVVLSSSNAALADGVWAWSNAVAWGTTTAGGAWQAGSSGNAAAVTVYAASTPLRAAGRSARARGGRRRQ